MNKIHALLWNDASSLTYCLRPSKSSTRVEADVTCVRCHAAISKMKQEAAVAWPNLSRVAQGLDEWEQLLRQDQAAYSW